MNRNIQTFIGCDAAYADARIALFGAPYDGTTSFRPGARFGPAAMRAESFGIETYSPYCDRDLADIRVFDGGDLELPFGNPAPMIDMVEAYADRLLDDNKIPFLLGGEHLVTLGALRAAIKKYPDLHIIQFDAHADLRAAYIGESLSHASVMRRAWEIVGDGRIHQFGIRSGEREEFEFARAHTRLTPFDLKAFPDALCEMGDAPIYFTLDLDVLDPSIFPGTGTPEAGGASFRELLDAILLLHQKNIVGCDVVELAPHYDASGASTAAACKLVREILLQL
ncbi:MAG: agmatinase [Christensenellales bacterium]|jgi:agmatinase